MESRQQVRRRKRYHVTMKGNNQEEQVVIIAYSPEEMKSLIRKLYKHIIFDDRGLPSGEISFKATDLL
ncbi:hypothetical protein L1999_12500 [Neobacillus drentensis]|uniref:hypothetical protein n=1 Tax=Neobacillus drentensis TaxID=220684 RepID=UPI001F2B2665|nr:hypothetical protein [Neobacillus drentensis]ULT59290.1 hypothetical protein L1999_12500 [Neobacillus drentensis]